MYKAPRHQVSDICHVHNKHSDLNSDIGEHSELFVDNLVVDNLFVDNLVVDNLFVDNLFADTLFADTLFVDN